jgi:hypothetical protein
MGLWCSQMSPAGWAVTLALWTTVLAAAMWALCRLFPTPAPPDRRAGLDALLAAGDIDQDTYRRARAHLDGHQPVPAEEER